MRNTIGMFLLAFGLTRLSYDIMPQDGLTTSLQFIGTTVFLYHVQFAFESFRRTQAVAHKAGDDPWN